MSTRSAQSSSSLTIAAAFSLVGLAFSLYLLPPAGTLQGAASAVFLAGIACSAGLLLAARRRHAVERDSIHSTLEKAWQSVTHTQLPASLGVPECLEKLTAEMQTRISHLQAETDGLKAILAAMEEGIIVVDSQKHVLVANPAARKILNIESDPVGKPLSDTTKQPDLLSNIELSVDASQACDFEIQLPFPGQPGKQFIMARCAPVHDESRTLSGAVAVLHDMSELRRLERMRTEFVANVSHELRTPLTSLMGYLETLEQGAWDDKEQAQQFLKICHRQAESLSRIVEDLLRLSKLENPQQDVAATEIDLGEIVSTAVEQCSSVAQTRRVTVHADLPEHAVTVRGERGLLVQAIANLIENGINYNRENGKVQVRLSRLNRNESDSESQWEVSVADTGIGIPSSALKHVFERFYRVDKARSRERGGTGLGLAIVKHIALAHGASVHVESEVNKGSTFYMRFKSTVPQSHPVAEA